MMTDGVSIGALVILCVAMLGGRALERRAYEELSHEEKRRLSDELPEISLAAMAVALASLILYVVIKQHWGLAWWPGVVFGVALVVFYMVTSRQRWQALKKATVSERYQRAVVWGRTFQSVGLLTMLLALAMR